VKDRIHHTVSGKTVKDRIHHTVSGNKVKDKSGERVKKNPSHGQRQKVGFRFDYNET
jgi:ABC-type methionine transport system ATPase subunit